MVSARGHLHEWLRWSRFGSSIEEEDPVLDPPPPPRLSRFTPIAGNLSRALSLIRRRPLSFHFIEPDVSTERIRQHDIGPFGMELTLTWPSGRSSRSRRRPRFNLSLSLRVAVEDEELSLLEVPPRRQLTTIIESSTRSRPRSIGRAL